MITEVDNSAREIALVQLREQMDSIINERVADVRPRREELERQLEAAGKELDAKVAERVAAIDAEYAKEREEFQAELARVTEFAEAHADQKLEEALMLADIEIVKAGGKVTRTAIAKVAREGARRLVAMEKDAQKRRSAETAVADTAMDDAKAGLADELHPLQEKERAIREEISVEFRERIQDLEELADPITDDRVVLLTENRYRELSDAFGHVFKAAMGAEAVLDVLKRVDLDTLRAKLKQEILTASGQRRKKATKRLNVVENLRDSGNKPEWMVFEVLPELPPELRPMVQLDGGRFATSDHNDLYRRVINRNNRLKRLLDLGAP
jgi:DNA-directed RNA polymerase subunit beta'